jgi:hypothetical protein
MAVTSTGKAKSRDPAEVVITVLALAIMVSFFGAIWWYVLI